MGPLEANASAKSRMANHTGRVPLPMPMGTNTSVNLRVAENTGRVPLPIPVEQLRRARGVTVNS